MVRSSRHKVIKLFVLVIFSLMPILSIEILLRIMFGLPTGLFELLSGDALYRKNAKMEMTWGPIPYTVETNSFGFRGKEIPLDKPKNKKRIVALGDSITDGFFVDNDATYPYFLEIILNANYQEPVEVVNAAKLGGSIDKEYTILRKLVMPLNPDIVLLTFVTNDISDIRGKSRTELLSMKLKTSKRYLIFTKWALTKTAIGEFMGDIYLRRRSKFFRYYTRNHKTLLFGEERYQIDGGNNYIENLKIAKQRSLSKDSIVLNEPYSQETTMLINNYLFLLEHMNGYIQNKDVKLIFIYFPPYSQIYDSTVSLKIRDILRDECKKLSIPFIDLTPAFRSKGGEEVLHLAPIDFHLNPKGNRVMAEAIAQFLVNGKFLDGDK